jgi:hypothetical protein
MAKIKAIRAMQYEWTGPTAPPGTRERLLELEREAGPLALRCGR